jgi:hypothetical protein
MMANVASDRVGFCHRGSRDSRRLCLPFTIDCEGEGNTELHGVDKGNLSNYALHRCGSARRNVAFLQHRETALQRTSLLWLKSGTVTSHSWL